jgi:hypothetical protein
MNTEVFDLSTMDPYNLEKIMTEFRKVTNEIVLYLPRTSNMNQIADFADVAEGDKIPVMHYCMNGASKVSTKTSQCYFSLMMKTGSVCLLRRLRSRLFLVWLSCSAWSRNPLRSSISSCVSQH